MKKEPSKREPVALEELLMSQMIQLDAVSQLLIEKGIVTEQEFFTKLKQVQADYQVKKGRI